MLKINYIKYIKWILTLILILLIVKETGIFTGIGFGLIALRIEIGDSV